VGFGLVPREGGGPVFSSLVGAPDVGRISARPAPLPCVGFGSCVDNCIRSSTLECSSLQRKDGLAKRPLCDVHR
jgi:hypothetical protein